MEREKTIDETIDEAINETDASALLQGDSSYQTSSVISLSSVWNHRKTIVRFVSAEVVVFFFMFTWNYYQHYSQQYFFHWYAIEALRNVSYSPFNKSICYNETLINGLSGSNQTINEVERQTAHMNLMVTLVSSVPSIFINLLVSPLSDTYGRKPVMILVLAGEAFAVVFTVIVVYLNLDPYWFIGSGVWIGLSGGMFTLVSVGFAYVTDVTPEKWRTPHLGLLQAMIYIATALASGVLNVWLQGVQCDFRLPVWLMVVSVTIGLVYSLLLPESIQKKNLSRFKQRICVLIQGLRIFFWPYLGYSIWRLWAVLLSILVAVLGETGESAIVTLFVRYKPLNWNLDLIGYYGILRSISHGLALFLVLPVLAFFKLPDPFIVLVGIAFTCGMNVWVGFLSTTWEMFVGEYPPLTVTIAATIYSFICYVSVTNYFLSRH